MIKLNGIVLSKDMILENLHSSSPVSATVETALDGSDIVFIRNTSRALDLVATEDSGWITLEQLKQLELLLEYNPSIMYLEYHGRLFTVRFRYEDSPVLDFKPIIPRPNEDLKDFFYGVIKLKEV